MTIKSRPHRSEASNRAELLVNVREMVGHDANFSTSMLDAVLNRCKNTIWRILIEDLGKRNVFAQFVTYELNVDQKRILVFFMTNTDFSYQSSSVFV